MNFLKFLKERKIEDEVPNVFIKFFSEEQHRKDFISGHLFTSPLKHFVDNESERGLGRGDNFEGVLTMNNATFKIHPTDQSNASIIPLGKGIINLFSPEMLKLHCFCTTGLFPEDFDVIHEDKGEVIIRCNISVEQLKQMEDEFGKYVCLFCCSSFIRSVNDYSNKYNENVAHMRIEYLDYSVNPKTRLDSYMNSDDTFFFQKSDSFSKEREYRFIFNNHRADSPSIINLIKTFPHAENVNTVDDLVEYLSNETISIKKLRFSD